MSTWKKRDFSRNFQLYWSIEWGFYSIHGSWWQFRTTFWSAPHGHVLKGAISDTMGWIWSVKNGMERADKKSIEQRSEQIWTVILPLHQPYWNASERGCLINRNTVFANQGFDQSKIASSFKMAQTWYPLVIQHNYGKSPFLIGNIN